MSSLTYGCARCGSKEHTTRDCPHGVFSDKCAKCGSTNHSTADCPHGVFSDKCAKCGSTNHATADCPHGVFSDKCAKCGSTEHATAECPHGVFSSKCARCGSTNHATADCPHGVLSARRAQDQDTRSSSYGDSSASSESTDLVAWFYIGFALAVIGLAIAAIILAVWIVVNIVVPVALLNSALMLTLASILSKRGKRVLAWAAFAGGCYLIADVAGGWLADDFVRNIVKNRNWITGFVLLNSAALGVSAYYLLRPLLSRAAALRRATESDSLRKSRQLLGAGIVSIAAAAALLPALYFSLPNSLPSLETGAGQGGVPTATEGNDPGKGNDSKAESGSAGKAPSARTGREQPRAADRADTWKDARTSLVWSSEDNGKPLTHGQASSYCEDLVLGGASDWRLPRIDELGSIYRPELQTYPKITAPLVLRDCCLWSADLVDEEDGSRSAWYFNYWLNAGDRARWDATSTGLNARALCVRGAGTAPETTAKTMPEGIVLDAEPAPSTRVGGSPGRQKQAPEAGLPAPSPTTSRAAKAQAARVEEAAPAESTVEGPSQLVDGGGASSSTPVATSAESPARLPKSVALDESTSLIWTTRDNGDKIDWEGATSYCENLELAGFTDWRLPSLAEVAGIYVPAPGGSSPTNFGATSVGLDLSSCCVWTSTSDQKGRPQFFSRASGKGGRVVIKAMDLKLMRAVCVRSAQ